MNLLNVRLGLGMTAGIGQHLSRNCSLAEISVCFTLPKCDNHFIGVHEMLRESVGRRTAVDGNGQSDMGRLVVYVLC